MKSMHMQSLVKFYPFLLMILSRNTTLTVIKGKGWKHYSHTQKEIIYKIKLFGANFMQIKL